MYTAKQQMLIRFVRRLFSDFKDITNTVVCFYTLSGLDVIYKQKNMNITKQYFLLKDSGHYW